MHRSHSLHFSAKGPVHGEIPKPTSHAGLGAPLEGKSLRPEHLGSIPAPKRPLLGQLQSYQSIGLVPSGTQGILTLFYIHVSSSVHIGWGPQPCVDARLGAGPLCSRSTKVLVLQAGPGPMIHIP